MTPADQQRFDHVWGVLETHAQSNVDRREIRPYTTSVPWALRWVRNGHGALPALEVPDPGNFANPNRVGFDGRLRHLAWMTRLLLRHMRGLNFLAMGSSSTGIGLAPRMDVVFRLLGIDAASSANRNGPGEAIWLTFIRFQIRKRMRLLGNLLRKRNLVTGPDQQLAWDVACELFENPNWQPTGQHFLPSAGTAGLFPSAPPVGHMLGAMPPMFPAAPPPPPAAILPPPPAPALPPPPPPVLPSLPATANVAAPFNAAVSANATAATNTAAPTSAMAPTSVGAPTSQAVFLPVPATLTWLPPLTVDLVARFYTG